MINELLWKTRQSYWNKIKVVLYLSNHATKKELSHATDVYTSDLGVGKLKNVPKDLEKLSDVVDNEVV